MPADWVQVRQLLGHLMQESEVDDLMKPELQVEQRVVAVPSTQVAQSPMVHWTHSVLAALLTYPEAHIAASHTVLELATVQFMQLARQEEHWVADTR